CECPGHNSADTGLAYRLFLVFATCERCEGNTSFACVLTEHSGQQSSLRERTRISFLNGLTAPKCHDLVSLAPLSSMPHFHPYLCPCRTSRFLTTIFFGSLPILC